MAKVSVIIPNFNHSKFLKQRIESVLDQTYRDFEVILLDDASTDDSKVILESYRDHPKISKIIYNEINSGSAFLQWQKGIDHATGEVIWMAESDDWAEENLLASLTGMLKKENTVMAFCRSNSVFENEKENLRSPIPESGSIDFGKPVRMDGYQACWQGLFRSNFISNASAVIFKKEAFLKLEEKGFEQMKLCGDWLIWLGMLKNGFLEYTPEVLSHFRFHPDSVRSTVKLSGQGFAEYLDVVEYIMKDYSPNRPNKIQLADSMLFKTKENLLNLPKTPEKIELLKRVRKMIRKLSWKYYLLTYK